MEPKNQLKYAQQHLANERTYLAWIRTAIAIVGVGFLATSLHFTIGQVRHPFIDFLSVALGIFAGILGIIVIALTTKTYKQKRQEILDETYYPTNGYISLLSTLLMVFVLLIVVYFTFLLAWQ